MSVTVKLQDPWKMTDAYLVKAVIGRRGAVGIIGQNAMCIRKHIIFPINQPQAMGQGLMRFWSSMSSISVNAMPHNQNKKAK